MPMNFFNMDSLKHCAGVHKFRQPNKDETEDDYREALANHVEPIDFIESCEIRYKAGWDKWTEEQSFDMLQRKFKME